MGRVPVAFNDVALTHVVVQAIPPTRTVDGFTKFVPTIAIVFDVPVTPVVGLIDVIVGVFDANTDGGYD